MKIIILNNTDIEGGAAKANFRIFKSLKKINPDTKLVTQSKDSDEFNVESIYPKSSKYMSFLKYQIDYLPARFYYKRANTNWSPSLLRSNTIKYINNLKPDITHLSWICKGFVPIYDLKKISSPIVWTLHDMWAFTGGCHYSGECLRYLKKCGNCPQLNSNSEYDLSRFIWKQKYHYWEKLNLTVVTPSRWLANIAKKSSLFINKKIEVIPNGLDLDIFKPIDKYLARNILKIPQDKKIILFGAISALHDERKGFSYLKDALNKLSVNCINKDEIELVIFGSSKPEKDLDLKFKTHYLGKLHDEITMSIVYSSADIFIAPSKEDNLPNTIMESLACATPCISFDIGGISDMVEHKKNGFLVSPFNVDELAHAINWALEDRENLKMLSYNSRIKVEQNFNIDNISKKYFSLYQRILSNKI